MEQNKIEVNVKKLTSAFKGIPANVVAEIVEAIGNSKDPRVVRAAIERILKKYKIEAMLKNAMIDGVVGSVIAGAGTDFTPVNSVKKWFTEKAYSDTGVKFSRRINDVFRRGEVVDTVRRGIEKRDSWRKVAQDMRDREIQIGDVAKDVQGLIDAARRSYALTGNVAGFDEYKVQVLAVKRRIERLVDPSTSKLKAAYAEFVNLTDGASADAVERAARYAIFHKQKYNAERIARTEMARAYAQAFQSEIAENEMVVAWRSVLSSAHVKKDVCDFHAKADLYGMGPGVYPKNFGPQIPYHPHCTCNAEQVYAGEVPNKKPGDFSSKRGEVYLKRLSKDDRIDLMGKAGAQRFKEDPKGWTQDLQNYQGQVSQKATIPRKVLHGE